MLFYKLHVPPKRERKKYYWYNGKLYPKTQTTTPKKEKAKYKKWFKSLTKKERAAEREKI